MITINWIFIVVCFAVFVITQIAKILVSKYLGSAWAKYIPLILLVILCVVYTIITKDVLNGLINGIAVTAFAVYFYQLVKPIIEKIRGN